MRKSFSKTCSRYIRMKNLDTVSNELPTYFDKLKRQQIINQVYIKKLQQELYRNIQKRKQSKLNNELIKLRFNELAGRNSISQDDLNKIKDLNNLNIKTLQKTAQQRNINTTELKKKGLIHTSIRSEISHKENNYLEYTNKDINNEILNKINDIRIQLVNVSLYLKKEELVKIRKRLYEIEKKIKINRSEKNKIT